MRRTIVALRTQEPHSHEISETLLEDACRLDGGKRVVLLQGGINQVCSGPLNYSSRATLSALLHRIPYDGVDNFVWVPKFSFLRTS